MVHSLRTVVKLVLISLATLLLGIAQQVVSSQTVLVAQQVQILCNVGAIERVEKGDTVVGFQVIEDIGDFGPGQFFQHFPNCNTWSR
jgi:hypothetical protein